VCPSDRQGVNVLGAARQPLGKVSALARLAVIGVALAAVGGTFAYLGDGSLRML